MTDRLTSLLSDLHNGVAWPVDDVEFEWSAARSASRKRERSPIFRRVGIAAAAVAVFALVLIVSPQARQAMANLLEAAGIKITFSEDLPLPLPGADLDLGDPIDLEDAISLVDFPIRVPGLESGAPDQAYLDEAGVLSMVWAGGDLLPSAGSIDVGMLFSQWSDDSSPLEGVKSLNPESTTVTPVLVDGSSGLWIEGAEHTLRIFDESGGERREIVRLAASVLIWDAIGVNYRIETTGDLDQALALAESLQPLSK